MSKPFRSSTYDTQRLPFYLALVVMGVTGCGSDSPASNAGGAGAAQAAAGAAAGGQSAGGAPSASGGAPVGGSAGAAIGAGGAAAGTGGAAAGASGAPGGTGGTAPSGGSGGVAGGAAGGAGVGGGSAGTGGAADCSSFSLCDDFEGAAPGATTSPWKVTMGGGYTVEVVSTPVHGGTHAVHMSAPSGTGGGYLTATKGFPATDFWGRAWVRVKSAATGHQCLMALNAASDQVRILNEMGSGEVATNLKTTDKLNDASATKVPQDTWFCFEWHQSPTALHVYIGSNEVTASAATWSIASINSLQIGIQRFQTGAGAADFYYDDVAVNTTRVGCN